MRIGLVAALLALGLVGTSAAQSQPVLQLQGQPYFGGNMKLHLSGSVGQPALLAYGLDPLPLDAPLYTGKGPWYIGTLVNLVALGSVPVSGRIDMNFSMPPLMPAFAGITIVMQGYVPFQLSNPATLQLDLPYFDPAAATLLPNPNPTVGASFGDQIACGDLNADGAIDVVVGAWFEDYLGIEKSGRVYVHWGPAFSSVTPLQPSLPRVYGTFGASVNVADLDGDSVDDLLVAETVSDPPPQIEQAYAHLYSGGTTFSVVPSMTIPSAGVGANYSLFGRNLEVGDFNSDQAMDFAVGIPSAVVSGFQDAGRIEFYFGPDFGLHAEIVNPTPAAGDFFGTDLSAIDVDGDGKTDLVVGSSRTDLPGAANSGEIHVFSGPTLQLVATVPNPLAEAGARFAEGLHVVDLDDDGHCDLIASDVKNRLFVLWGPTYSDVIVRPKPPTQFANPFGESSFGYFLEAFDANDDGVKDIVIADPFSGALSGCSPAAEGTIYVSLGPYYATYLPLYEPQPACGDLFSWATMLFDLDGDGGMEVLTGSVTDDLGAIGNAGRVTILRP